MNLNRAKVNESLSLITLLKRNVAECRNRDAGNGIIDVVYNRSTRQNIEAALERLEITISSMIEVAEDSAEEVPVLRIPTPPVTIAPPTPAPEAAPDNNVVATTRSNANRNRDKEIKQMLQATTTQQQVSAIGANRDTVSRTLDVKNPMVSPPETELRTDNEYLPPMPGTDARPVSPFERLTQNDYSEFLRLFAQSPFVPNGHGVMTIPGDFKWHREYDIKTMDGINVARLPQGAYGHNEETGGPEFVMIRLQKAAVLWNLGEGVESVRIFYIGRSNVSGYWLTAKHLTISEQVSVISGLVDMRNRAAAEKKGEVYNPVARLRD